MSAARHIAVAAALALALVAPSATGHAFLDKASPPVGSSVTAAPAQVTLKFSERVEPAFSRVQVVDAAGQRVDKADARVVDDGNVLAVSLAPLPRGRYTVRWRVLSVDTHVTEGDYTFEVAR